MTAHALRIGLMVPINTTTMEPELLAWLPVGSTCRTLRIPRQKGLLTLADIPAYAARGVELAGGFRDDPLDLVVYGCTAAGILAGRERDAVIVASLSQATGRSAVSTVNGMVAWLAETGARDIALVTPCQDDVNGRLCRLLESSGIRVRVLSSFRTQSVDELGRITTEQVAARARDDARRLRCDVHRLLAASDARNPRRAGEGIRPAAVLVHSRHGLAGAPRARAFPHLRPAAEMRYLPGAAGKDAAALRVIPII